jgi:predicted RNase H-like nuclease (RuvC/YqgF family)
MGGVLSNPSVSKEQVQTMVTRQIVPIQNTSQSIDKKLNMVVTAITDQIMELKELMAQQKVDTVKELQGKLNSAERESQFSNPQDENSLERERQIELMRGQLEAAQAEANTARRNANSARREKNELNAQKQKANANLVAAKQAATTPSRWRCCVPRDGCTARWRWCISTRIATPGRTTSTSHPAMAPGPAKRFRKAW